MINQKLLRQEMSRLYTQAANQLASELPRGWSHICLGFFVDENENETMLVYYSMDDGKSWQDFMEYVMEADEIVKGAFDCKETCQKLWRLCKVNGSKWSIFTLLVNAQGGFEVNYDYDRLEKFTIAVKKMWRGQYLG